MCSRRVVTPLATDVVVVSALLTGVAVFSLALGYAVGRWSAVGVVFIPGLAVTVAWAASPDGDGSYGLLWWLLMYPAAVAIVATALGVAIRKTIRTRRTNRPTLPR